MRMRENIKRERKGENGEDRERERKKDRNQRENRELLNNNNL